MANKLGKELAGKVVVLSKKKYRGDTPIERAFLCKDGFGCNEYTKGTAIIGKFLIDGEEARIDGWAVQRMAFKKEINQLISEKKLPEGFAN